MLPEGCRRPSEPRPVSCLTDTRTPGGEVNCVTPRLCPGHELPQCQSMRTDCKEMGTHDPGTEDAAAAAAASLQSCPTLCDPRDSSPPGSPVPGILQARTLEQIPTKRLIILSSFLARTQPVKSSELFVYYSPPNLIFLYKSVLLQLPCRNLHVACTCLQFSADLE